MTSTPISPSAAAAKDGCRNSCSPRRRQGLIHLWGISILSSFSFSVVASWIEYINRIRGAFSLSLIGAIPKRASFIYSGQCLFYAYFKNPAYDPGPEQGTSMPQRFLG